MKRSGPIARKKPMKKRGRRMSEWDKMLRKLKKAFGNAMIFTCEIRHPGCWNSYALGFAHSLKRRNIPPGSPLLAEVVLSCNHCHDIVEGLGEPLMAPIIRRIIAERATPIVIKLNKAA